MIFTTCSSRLYALLPLLLLPFGFLLAQAPPDLLAQAPPDTTLLQFDLASLTVAVSASKLPPAAPLSRLDAADIGRYDNSSLVASFNSLPGVRLEERSPGSYRVSVRGSSLRAPFGVRNVKIYWNGFALTEPGGDTYLNLIDPIHVQQAQVFKGPAGSLYGSGTGGAILLNSQWQTEQAQQDELGLQLGSFGTARLDWQHHRRTSEQQYHQIRFAHQQTDGFRDHSQLQRSVAELSIYQTGKKGGNSSYHVLATDLHYEIPGALNPTQFADNPRQARPGSEAAKAAINYQNLWVGGRWGGPLPNLALRHQTDVFASANVFDHPFNIDHKRERNLGIGLRSSLRWEKDVSGLGLLQLVGGLESQVANKAARNYTPNAGRPGALNFIDDIVSSQQLIFNQVVVEQPSGWQMTAGWSLQKLTYRIDRSFEIGGETGLANSNFNWVLSPRLSVAKAWTAANSHYNSFFSYGKAYTPPTLSEFRTNEGSINTRLAPERGHSLELALSRDSRAGFDISLNVYYQWLRQSIATFQDSSGVQLFRNTGGSRQWGIEASIERELLGPAAQQQFIRSCVARLAYTYNQGVYQGYAVADKDFSGQALPGLTPSTFDWQLSLQSRGDYALRLGLYTAAATPLDDGNEVFSQAFALLRARLSKRLALAQKQPWLPSALELYAGGDNLLNQSFSLGYDLNPQFGQRYFQPAAGINFYLGLRLHW